MCFNDYLQKGKRKRKKSVARMCFNDQVRMCIDFKNLNLEISKDEYVMSIVIC